MSNNNFYNNFDGSTFQNNYMPPMFIPPPPRPPPQLFVTPPPSQATNLGISDDEYLRTFENKALNVIVPKQIKALSISEVRNTLKEVALSLNELKRQEKMLVEKMNTCTEEEWKTAIEEVGRNKTLINGLLSNVNVHLDTLKNLIAKRTAKRLRIKRLRIERKIMKKERVKELEENSRKIDENLQKIKDAINKVKQEEESKLQADMVLKEVLRKKHNAKKFVLKLDALKKLRNARVNTARGRGANISVKECEEFDEKIEKLKLLWAQKLTLYEKEEENLRTKLKQDGDTNDEVNIMEKQVVSNLKKWRKVLFGDSAASPQVDFGGDMAKFVAVRCQWDQYASESGSSLPIGWVTPTVPSQ